MPDRVSVEIIAAKIIQIRGKRVMLDGELAKLYGVTTKYLTRQVRRNIERFPVDFMFQLTKKEYKTILRCQFGALEKGKYSKYLPYAFTEQGIAMLSSVLNSDRAVKVNIQIMRAFIKLKELFLTHKGLAIKLRALEKKYANHDKKIKYIFEAIRQLLLPPPEEKRKIVGFHP